MTDTLDALERLARLHQSGALTDAEFAAQKARVIGRSETHSSASHDYHSEEPAGFWSAGKLLLAGLGAILLGVVLWWQLVDSDGALKPVPTPGRTSAARPSGEPKVRPLPAPASSAAADAPLIVQTGTDPAPVTYAPSFDCAGQNERTLVMICESRTLSRKDRELSALFKDVLRSLDDADRRAVLRQQRAFLRERNACRDTACLDAWYDRTLAIYRDG